MVCFIITQFSVKIYVLSKEVLLNINLLSTNKKNYSNLQTTYAL